MNSDLNSSGKLTRFRARFYAPTQAISTDIATPLHDFVSRAFSEGDSASCAEDFGETQRLRDSVERALDDEDAKGERLDETKDALTAYYRALCVIESRFPISGSEGHAGVDFAWLEGGRASPRGGARARDVQYEKCAVLFNYGGVLSRSGVVAFGCGEDGVKRACAAFQAAAGAFEMLGSLSERKLGSETPSADVTREHCEVMVKLHLAQAQECFYEKAKGKSPTMLAKLAQQAKIYYEQAYATATTSPRLVGYVDDGLLGYLRLKIGYFSAEAMRLAAKGEMAANDENAGIAVARLQAAKDAMKKAIDDANVVSSDATLVWAKKYLEEDLSPDYNATLRDNECVYMCRVPKLDDVPPVPATGLVKAVEPAPEQFSPVGVDLFKSIIPDSGAKALSRYTEMVDELIRNETETLAMASDEARLALREMELPETLLALSAPVALSVDLEEQLAAFRSSGSASSLTASLQRVDELNRQCAGVVKTIRETLDTESAEDSAARSMHGEGVWRREPSSSKNRNMTQALKRFEVDLEVATKSDEQLRQRIEGAGGVLESIDEDNLESNAPRLTQPLALLEEDSHVATDIQAVLQDLETIGDERAEIEDMMRRIKCEDDILHELMAQSGESLDALFTKEMKKYDQAKDRVVVNISKQADALSMLRALHERFVQVYDVESLRRDIHSHEQSVRHALSVVGDLRSGMEQGVRFYSGFLDAARHTLTDVQEYASARRMEKETLVEELRVAKDRADAHAAQLASQMNQMRFQQHPYPSPQYGYAPPPQYGAPSPQYGAQYSGAPPPPPPPSAPPY